MCHHASPCVIMFCYVLSGDHFTNRKRKVSTSAKGAKKSKRAKGDTTEPKNSAKLKQIKLDPNAAKPKKQMVDGVQPIADSIDLAGAPPCPFSMNSIKFNLYLGCLLHRKSAALSQLFPGNVDSRQDSRLDADRRKLLHCLGLRGLPNVKAVKKNTNLINGYRQRIYAKKFPDEPDKVFAKLPPLSGSVRTGVQVNHITQAQLATIAVEDYVGGDILEYFIRHFESKIKNSKVHIPSPLFMAALFYDQKSDKPSKLDFRRIGKDQSILVPEGFFQKGGTAVLPMNYPVNSHWITTSVTTRPPNRLPEVFEFKIQHGHQECRDRNDPIVAPLLAHMMETVMTQRQPNPEKARQYVVKSCKCEPQSTNGCAMRVVAQVILHLMGWTKKYKVDMTFDKALRDWMFHYIFKYKLA